MDIPELRILAHLAVSLLELILGDGLALDGSRGFNLTDKSLIIDLNRQDFRLLIRVERMLALNLLLRRSRVLPFMVLDQVDLITGQLSILRGEALSCEGILLL